ncbi:MarR family winged helix-turn-helix transcriptional regulator [Candidatus Latescibacterota bacterium]
MSLQHELCFLEPFKNLAHETLLSIVVTGTLLVKEGHRILLPFSITEAQFNVLMLLKHQTENGRMSQTRLGKMLLVNRSNVTGLIDRMEQVGWVRRTADIGDRRVNQVEITESGHEIIERSQKAYYTRIEEIMSVLSPEERKHLCRMLESVRESGIH